jgi:hypothetical protein
VLRAIGIGVIRRAWDPCLLVWWQKCLSRRAGRGVMYVSGPTWDETVAEYP